jgi:CubicO group peptidase (beta-lactamase class C family)
MISPKKIAVHASWGGRWSACFAAAALTASLVAACEGASTSELTSGVWRGEQGPWTVVVEFAAHEGALAGVAHILEGGRHWTEATITDVVLAPPRLAWHLSWGPSLQQDFEGRVDLAGGTIKGEVSSPSGPVAPMRFERTAPGAVPGLLTRASPAEYSWARPAEVGDGWNTATPEEVGVERSAMEALIRAVIRGEAGNIHSLLIAKGGALVAEEYFHGWTRDELHSIASCTKSVVSLLVGRALEQGHLESLQTPVIELVPDLAEGAGRGWESVRLEHLLTMTAGLGRPESAAVETPGRELYLALLHRPVEATPGTRWEYANADVDLLGPVLRKATGVDPDEYAATVLFTPLGIEAWQWPKREGSLPSLAAGLKLRPRDMARIGALVAGRGQWQGRRILQASWIEQSTRVHVSPPDQFEQYGYLWWSPVPPEAPEAERFVYAKGVGSQFIFVAPGHDLVITATGGNHANDKLMAIAELVGRFLLDARGHS